MKKLLCLFVVLFAVSIVSYGQLEEPPTETADRDWEAAPNLISGGYSAETGAYVYRLYNVYTCPGLSYDRNYYYTNIYQAIINVGYGEFQKYGGGSLISYDNTGEITKEADESTAISYSFSDSKNEITQPPEYTGQHAPAYVYKKENIQKMSIVFSSESYTAQKGQKLIVNVFVIGGSGYYSGKTVKPAFLSTVGKLAYEGTCYDPVQTSISTIVTDTVTGQQCATSVDIIITEEVDDPNDDPNNPSNPSDPSDPSNPSNPSDPSNPDSPDAPSDPDSPDAPSDPTEPSDPANPSNPSDPSNPDSPDEPSDPSEPDVPSNPSEPSNPDSPDAPDVPDEPTDPDEPIVIVPNPTIPDEPVVIVPGDPDEPNIPDFPDEPVIIVPDPAIPDGPVVVVPNPEPTEPNNDDNEPIVVVIDDNDISDTDTIIVTDDGVTKVRKNNHDLAIFLGMFGAMTGFSGSANAPSNAPLAIQQARQRSQNNE